MKKNWTRLMALVLSMAMALTLMQGVALAAETAPVAAQEAAVLNQANTCGDKLTWSYSNKTLTISGEGKMYDYNTKDAPWERYDETATKLVISSGVTSIGAEAFDGFERVTSVSLPSSLKTIGAGAFEECESLTSITIPAKVTSIGREAFAECESLSKITFKGSAPTIGTNAFEDVRATVTYPAGDASWTDSVRKNYGAKKLTWKSSSGSSSASSSTTTTVTKLSKPDVEDPINKAKGILVRWEKVKNAEGYYVYRKVGSAAKWTKVATVKGGNVLSWKDAKATSNGTLYRYTVKAYAGKVVSKCEADGEETYRLTRPSITSSGSSSQGALTVQWSKNAKASGYQVQYSTNSSFAGKTTKTVSGASTLSKTTSGLQSGQKYYIRVRAYKKAHDDRYYSAWSAVTSVTVK